MNINGKIKLLALLDISVYCVGFEITCLLVYWFYQGISPTRQGQTSIAKFEENIRFAQTGRRDMKYELEKSDPISGRKIA
jgi:hypothetical protein